MMARRIEPPDNSQSRPVPVHDRLRQAQAAQSRKLEQYRQAAALRAAQARQTTEQKSTIPIRDAALYLKALDAIPFYELGRSGELHPSAVYKRLVELALKNMNAATREAVLCWPNCAPSPAAIAAMLTLADCGSTAPIKYDGKDALAAPLGLRALIYPYARTTHRALRHIYVGKDYLGPLQLKHQVRCFDSREDQALADYHKTLARVRTLTGKALDGKEYPEFRNPCVDELIPSGPCVGTDARSELLSRVRTKTDLTKISRTGLADDRSKARFYIFGLRASEEPMQALRNISKLDLVLLDLTSTGRNRLGKNWLPRLRAFLSALEARLGSTAVLALTDDPWTFDALRFDALHKEPKRRRGDAPAPSSVIFAPSPDIVLSSDPPALNYAAVKHQEVISFGGEAEAVMRDLRSARRAALELNDGENADRLGALIGAIGRCVSLPAPRTLLGEYITQELGPHAAADTMAVYRVGSVTRELQQSHGPWAQTARPVLQELCQRVEKLAANTDQLSPMAPLLRDVLSHFLRNSSKTAVMFPKDMLADFAAHALSQDKEVGTNIENRLQNGMWLFLDRAGLDDLEKLSSSQRNYIKNLIVVAPSRSAMMSLLARAWLPDNLTVLADSDTLASAVRDANRLARYSELVPLKSRMEGFAAKASDAVRRVTNSGVILDQRVEPSDEAALPPSGVVNLAGRSQADQTLVRLELEGGQTIIARPGTKLVLQDQSRTLPLFVEEEARNVDVGDRVCVIGDAFLEVARPLLNITARAAEEIRDYHELVLKRFEALTGNNEAQRLALLVSKMGLPTVTTQRAHYWIDLKSQMELPLHEVVPHAPRDLETFLPFMSALSVSDAIARRYWTWAVIAQRTSRLRAAFSFHDAYRSILVDNYAAQSDNPDRARDVRQLKAAAENFISVVRSKREQRGDDARA